MSEQRFGMPKAIGAWHVETFIRATAASSVYSVTKAGIQAHAQLLDMDNPDPDITASVVIKNAQRLRTFFSPEVAPLLGEELFDGAPTLISDAPRGATLHDLLSEGAPLSPVVWTEVARAALLGTAALRAGRIQCAQVTPDSVYVATDLVNTPRVVLSEFWSAGPLSEVYRAPELSGVLNSTGKTDCFSIGQMLLQSFAPAKKPEEIAESDAIAAGFSAEHFAVARGLADPNPERRLTIEQALRSLPGVELATVPLFAQDAPHQTLRRRAVRKWMLRGVVAAVAVALVAVGLPRLIDTLGSPTEDQVVAQASPSVEEVPENYLIWLRLTKDRKLFPFAKAKTYVFRYCFKNSELSDIENQRRVIVQKRVGEDWETTPISVLVKQEIGCEGDSYLLEFTTRMPFMPNELGADWSECVRYRVLVPDKGKEKRASIPFCVQAKNLNA
jgi:hypothetical protein